MKTEYEKFNEFLIALGNADRVGFRKKIVLLKKYIAYLLNLKNHEPVITPKSEQNQERAL